MLGPFTLDAMLFEVYPHCTSKIICESRGTEVASLVDLTVDAARGMS